jgi:hypothetical protein
MTTRCPTQATHGGSKREMGYSTTIMTEYPTETLKSIAQSWVI